MSKGKLQIIMALVLALGVMALLSMTTSSLAGLVLLVDPAARAAEARYTTLAASVRLASESARAMVSLASGGMLAGALVWVILAGAAWIRARARLIYARDGLFPVVVVPGAGLYDPNRDNAGASDVLTLAALTVQQTAAAGRIAPTLSATPAGESTPPPPPPWPGRVPLRGLLDGVPTLERLVLGVTVTPEGLVEPVTGDMADLVHIAIGGSSGWGKSVFLRSLAYQIAVAVEQPDMVAIDLEGVTLAPLQGAGRLLYPLADTERDAAALLEALSEELERRKALFARFPGIDSLKAYNARVAGVAEPMRPIILLMDEATALLRTRAVEDGLCTVTLRARKYGLWAILSGQDWKANTLNTTIRNQLGTRIQFKAMSGSQSAVLLGQSGAEDLTVKGRALAVLPGRGLVEIQAPMVGDDLLRTIPACTGAPLASPTPAAEQEADGAQAALATREAVKAAAREVARQKALEVRRLAAEGVSRSEIARRVYGYAGGWAFDKIKTTLDTTTIGEDETTGATADAPLTSAARVEA